MERTFDSDSIGDYFGFVYCITNKSNQRQYIGENISGHLENLLERKEKSNKTLSDWKRYYGSCPELKEKILKSMAKSSSVEKS